MRLIRDLWETSARRTLLVACLITLTAVGQALAAAFAGPVLVHRSGPLFTLLAGALAVAVICDLAVGLVTAGLTADWAADVRRRLCRVALGQDLPTLETTPVGELLDRIDGDVGQVAGELRGSGVRLVQSAVAAVVAIVTALVVWFPAGCGMLLLAILLVVLLSGPTRKIAPARVLEEAAWSDVAAVMEEAIHGQDDVRTSLAQPYVLRMYARKASTAMARGRAVWTQSATVSTIASAVTRAGIALVVVAGGIALASGHIEASRLTSIWLLALAFGITVEHLGRTIPELQYALGAWDRVRQLAAAPQEPVGGAAPTDGDLTIRGLTFRYPDPARAEEPTSPRPPVLRDLNLTFERGHLRVDRSDRSESPPCQDPDRAVSVPGERCSSATPT
jgi:ABC-type multidrug transport system fused ATPase/permease subunit